MKQITFTLVLMCAVAMVSCRKDKNDVDIKTYDQQQIQQYISANGLTGMQRDLTSGDTTGMYYQILTPGKGAAVGYSTQVSLVYTLKSFDGKYSNADTSQNHIYEYVGHLTQTNAYMTKGSMLAIINLLKNKGGRMRLLVPSRLAFGASGSGTGSSEGANRIAGNQGVDYYINMIDNQDAYDEIAIKNYMIANSLSESEFTKLPSGVRYKITRAGVPSSTVTPTSSLEIQYTSFLLDGVATLDSYNTATGSGVVVNLATDTRTGLREALLYGTPGCQMTILIPSSKAYGTTANTSSSLPANSCLRYDVNVLSVQ